MLKDITIGQYYKEDSLIHRLDPRVKLFAVLIYVITLFMHKAPATYVMSLLFLIITIKISKVPVKYILRGLKAIAVILLFSVMINMLFIPGKPVIQFWIISISAEGIRTTIYLGSRLIMLVLGTSLLTFTTTPNELTDGLDKSLGFLNKIGVPVHEIAMMMSIALRFIPILTEELEKNPLIEIIHQEVTEIEKIAEKGIVIIATGPLTSEGLSKEISKITGEDKLHFYDAAAPIVTKESIDFNIAFFGNRYEQEKGKDETIDDWKERLHKQEASYINLPMNKDEYEKFVEELINAEVITLHEFEKREIFEGCMPVEVMAKRGKDTLRYGPLKPVGFDDPRTGKRPYAVIQLRQDNELGTIYNIVGFQTNLKYGEQKRVFGMIPGLQNAEFVKYGVMHRNTYINSTKLLDNTYNFKDNKNIYFAGQITGVEGYVESISSGMVSALNAVAQIKNESRVEFSNLTMIGALAKYISTANDKFQPMNANFGIVPELPKRIKDKKIKYGMLADRAIENLKID